ncbi:MAG TPA: formate dehydrogenase subunit alpha [Methanotrichaceae archaeon]|nr:formate dehydrogenase subunit alpha [Methanotrichaceae archaeon]
MDKVHTTCIYCGCGCGLFLHVEDGHVVGASPSSSHPLSRGRLCIKGWLAGDFVGHPDRLKHPLIRQGERLVRASWDEALSLTTASLWMLREEFGPGSVGVLTSAKGTNEENYLLMKLARAGLKTNNVDHVARLCHAPTVAGLGYALGSGAMTNSIKDLGKTDAILVVGSNTTEQHPLVAAYILEARKKGAKLIVADPRKTQLADLADIRLSPRPGTDIAWINSMLNIIIQEGLDDREFISARTEGFDDVRRSVEGYTPEKVEKISGIPAEDLRAAARIYGTAERAAIVYAMGITQHVTGTDNVQALANLALATGNIGREGTGIYPLRGHQNVQGACDMGALPDVYSGYQKVAQTRSKFEEAWSTELPESPGKTALEMLTLAEEGSLKGLLIVGENPMMSFPDQSRVRKALESLDFLAVFDIFPTETTELADVVLPAASFAEKDGTFTSTERRIQRINRAADPPGEARPEWKVVCEMLRRLNVPADYSSPAEVMDEIASLTPIYGGISYDRLGQEGLQWPCPSSGHPGTEILHSERFPIGLARFRPVDHLDPFESPDENYPFLLTTGRSLYQFHTGTMTRRTSLLEREMPLPFVEVNAKDAAELKIRNGQMVVVESRRGSISLEARITPGISKGMLFMPFHFHEAPANMLTSQALDPASRIPELKVTAARIRRIEQ